MNNARDELAKVIVTAYGEDADVECPCEQDLEVADAILKAGYRKPLTIENEKLVIDDGLLLLDVGSCTCSPYGSSHELGCGFEYLDDLTKPLARAGYSRPRTVSTVAELDALPFEAVIRDAEGHVLEKWGEPHETMWATVMVNAFIPRDDIALPASVLYEPEGK